MESNQQTASDSRKTEKIVIAGGGPSGLATALMLTQHGYDDITIIEKRAEETFDFDVAYTYFVDGRGQRLTNLLNLTTSIADRAVEMSNFGNITEIKTNKQLGSRKMPTLPSKSMKYFISRARFLDIFMEAVNANKNIKILFNTVCQEISQDANGKLSLHIAVASNEGSDGNLMVLQPDVLIGCDGIHSVVRKWMMSQDPTMKVEYLNSPSVGLKFKMLKVKSDFIVPSTSTQSVCEKFYAIETTGKTPETSFRIGLFPMRSIPGQVTTRTCANVCRPNHILYTLKTFEDVKAFLTKSLPQFDNINDLVEDDEMRRFASSSEGSFPMIQYTSKLQCGGGAGGTHVLILGDAAHAFPPDLGAGLNAALEDVYHLHVALVTAKEDIGQALPLFEAQRHPDIAALCKLVQIGFPYQYRQSQLMYGINMVNLLFRMLLHKAAPFLFSPAAFMMTQDHEIPFRVILQRAYATTNNIIITFGALAAVSGYALFRKYFE